jgi:hypothetical protein
MVHVLRGFVDAGGVGELVREHLADRFEARRLVTFDVDQLLDYRSKRASMTFDSSRWTAYDEPTLAIDHLRDTEGTGFLVLHGPEPDLQWERFVAAVAQVVDDLGVSLAVTAHGIPMAVPHTRPVSATVHATRAELTGSSPSWFGRAEVPASASALLELRLGELGRDAVGFAEHVPHYVAQAPYLPAAVHALGMVQGATGLALDQPGLAAGEREALDEVGTAVAASDELTALVRGLEQQYDSFTRSTGVPSLLADESDLPTADEIGAEFEQFLAQHRDD